MMKVAGLFEGFGGFALAAQWMGWESVLHCEINPFCQQLLKYYWPNAALFSDIRTTDFTSYRGKVDILTGGFPCQPFSTAGKRNGHEHDSYLWPEMLRAIREIRPRVIVGENVAGIISMEDKSGVWRDLFPRMESRTIVRFDDIDVYEAVYTRQTKMLVASICQDLEKEGYTVQPISIPAASVQAPHKRERIWFLAHAQNQDEQQCQRRKKADSESGVCGFVSDVANTASPRLSKPGPSELGEFSEETGKGILHRSEFDRTVPANANGSRRGQFDTTGITEGSGLSTWLHPADWSNWPSQSPICGRNDGLPAELDRITFSKWRCESIKGFGNAIVPEVAFEIFKALSIMKSHVRRPY